MVGQPGESLLFGAGITIAWGFLSENPSGVLDTDELPWGRCHTIKDSQRLVAIEDRPIALAINCACIYIRGMGFRATFA